MKMTTKLRWIAVTLGLLCTQGILSVISTTPQEGVDLFPTGALLLGGIAISVLVLITGMLYEFRSGASGPLVAGTLGSGLLLYVLRAEHGASPNWLLLVGVIVLVLLPSFVRMAISKVAKH